MPTLGYQKVNSDKFKENIALLRKSKNYKVNFNIENIHL